jgi:hypothetical protein
VVEQPDFERETNSSQILAPTKVSAVSKTERSSPVNPRFGAKLRNQNKGTKSTLLTPLSNKQRQLRPSPPSRSELGAPIVDVELYSVALKQAQSVLD